MIEVIYALCALTSTFCAALLVRAWLRTRARLLFLCALCFVGLALNNIGLFLDLVVYPHESFALVRTAPAVLGLAILVGALVWEEL